MRIVLKTAIGLHLLSNLTEHYSPETVDATRRVTSYLSFCQGASVSLSVDAFSGMDAPDLASTFPPPSLPSSPFPSLLLIRILLNLYTLIRLSIRIRQASTLARELLVPRVPFCLWAPFSLPSLRISQGSARRGCGVTLLHRRHAEFLRCGGWFFEQPTGCRLRRDW